MPALAAAGVSAQPAPLQWIRPPAQGRSEQTLRRLLDATEHLLRARSFDQLTVQDVVREARSSVGSFYARFDSKEALLRALHERYVEESWPTTDAALSPSAWEGVPLPVVVERICAFLVEATWDARGFKRALVVASAHDEPFRRRSAELAGYVVAKMAALLEARRDEHACRDARRAAGLLHRVIFSFLDQMVVYGDEDPIGDPRPRDELAADLAALCHAYLLRGDALSTRAASST